MSVVSKSVLFQGFVLSSSTLLLSSSLISNSNSFFELDFVVPRVSIKLYDDNLEILDNCLTRILHSPRILKLDGTEFVRVRVKVVVSGSGKVMIRTGLHVLGDGGLESFRVGIVCFCLTSSSPFSTMGDVGLESSSVGVC
ncbi:hypothetical protein Drorol1_Dr00021905 [Drosera rotundifolia]